MGSVFSSPDPFGFSSFVYKNPFMSDGFMSFPLSVPLFRLTADTKHKVSFLLNCLD